MVVNARALALTVLLAALISVEWQTVVTQKTIKQSSASFGSNQQAVYGGYQQQVAPVSPVRRPAASKNVVSSSFSRQEQQQQTFVPQEPQYQQQQVSQSSSSSYEEQSSNQQQAEADAEPASYGSVGGSPGQDFPAYTQVPKTSFSCDGKPYQYGMYADEETGCQAYHLCYNGRKESFLCGIGTVFNQRILHCDYWYSVECNKSSQYYSSNAYMGSSQPEPGPAQASGSSSQITNTQQSSYQSSSSSSIASPARQRPIGTKY